MDRRVPSKGSERPLVSHIVPRFAVVSLLVVEMTFWLSMQLRGVLRL
jgi:hypothetical protein